MHDTVGVVIATYNGEKYIEDQLESICQQTYKPDSIIVTDGGSDDHTIEICKSVSEKYENIEWKILRSDQRLSVADNFERGMNNCDSNFIFLCDQDDFWYKNKIEEYIKAFESHSDCIVVISNADVVDSDLMKTGKTQWETIRFTPDKEVLEKKLLIAEMLHRNIFTGMCMAYRNGIFSYDKIKSDYMLHDEAIGWFGIFNGEVFVINKPLAAYRQHNGNVVGAYRHNKFTGIKEFKVKVESSSKRIMLKLTDLISLYGEYDAERYLENARLFYKERCGLFSIRKHIAFKRYLKSELIGNYKKYCSKTERASLKDIICILF